MCLQRGRFEDGKLDGICMKETKDQNIYIGIF
jgi:hypothetical protein